MKKTLQDQYLLIKEGKGHKGVFLADAKRDFPHIVPNAATFNEAVASLKTKNIISENIIGLSAVVGYEPRKKETYETAFEDFLAEARKVKENEDEKVKAEEKKVSKPVEKDLEHNFDNKDDKNPDNLIFGQIMMGYYTEMKDPKNADKTMQQIKDIVLKNLAKDPIHYTKDGQFGVKDLGYTTEAPGLGTPKEPKGKYASSGYGNLSEAKELNVGDKVKYKGITVTVEKKDEAGNLVLKSESGKTIRANKSQFKEYGSLEEEKLRKVIREMIDAELKSITPSQSLKESVEKDLAAINKEAEHEVLQSKLDKIDVLIDKRKSQLGKLDEDEDMKALTDKKKVKELEKDIKKLEQAKAKVEKMIGKTKGKKKEVIDETEDDMVDENMPLDDNMMGEEMSYDENY